MSTPHRKKIRIKDYDYSLAGGYFVTICTNNKTKIFSNVSNGEVNLTPCGKMIDEKLKEMGNKYNGVILDEYVIMPNHIHVILILEGDSVPLHSLIGKFKSVTTVEYFKRVKDLGWKPVDKKLWQRNYYEHVIRNNKDLFVHRNYIEENPTRWDSDEYY
ncbi:transposase [Alkalicella caledoniensis]|uniref:Transposase n=1 Tax=Alkalicella caledoniensis TaxID=2731377 RepID=A0A7G9WA51_ALKCA|nr:transposase [Alkalicella caledoniensis]QNO15563.1 transposase [Alkalicella caledoniensis]